MPKLWWIVCKDLVAEGRARQIYPRLLTLGVALGFLLYYQLDVGRVDLREIAGSLCWLTLSIASVLSLGHAMTAEHEEGCWDGLRHYPVGAATIFAAKTMVNAIGLGALQGVVVPFFAVITGVGLAQADKLLLVCLLGNLAISSIGTLIGAMSSGVRNSSGLLPLLLLPLLVPVILAASRATTLIFVDRVDQEWWRWVQLLGASALIYVTAGWVLFDLTIED